MKSPKRPKKPDYRNLLILLSLILALLILLVALIIMPEDALHHVSALHAAKQALLPHRDKIVGAIIAAVAVLLTILAKLV